jgi:hypothetical protein
MSRNQALKCAHKNTSSDTRSELICSDCHEWLDDIRRWEVEEELAEARRDNDKLRADLKEAQADVEAAAGDLPIPIPAPGTTLARLCIANTMLRQTFADAYAEVNRQTGIVGVLVQALQANQWTHQDHGEWACLCGAVAMQSLIPERCPGLEAADGRDVPCWVEKAIDAARIG